MEDHDMDQNLELNIIETSHAIYYVMILTKSQIFMSWTIDNGA